MDNRPPLAATRPLPPQRAVSGSALQFLTTQARTNAPSRLSNVRSVSQPAHLVNPAGRLLPPRTIVLESADSLESVSCSPVVIDVDEDKEDGEPVPKRAKIGGDGFRAGINSVDGEPEFAFHTASGVPAAGLPKPSTAVAKATSSSRSRHGGDSVARRANGVDPPPAAVRLPLPKNVADFSPWSGHHPEDVLNEAVVKAGYCDKGPATTQTECNSAKPSIWQNLSSRNNMGLQTLSYLFTQVMDKRQILGKCITPSTFKPPPRVTVTDTKREAWLRDLANPDVPLRKQSRTIPHGIRGKLLMDQCLGKDIPLHRAVWLAKCVGANELRAFRRKGVSGAAAATGESKWVREWTVHVEQFLEGIITTCGQPGWQSRMDYAVRLTTAFYVENLLDSTHFLAWIVSCFADATMETLPIWIIMVQIYWRDIVTFTRRGRQLAEAVLDRLQLLTQEDIESSISGTSAELDFTQASAQGTPQANTDVPATQADTSLMFIEQGEEDPRIAQAAAEAERVRRVVESRKALKSRLQRMIAILAVTQRGCLVLPHIWKKYKQLLTPAMALDTTTTSIANHIASRNERLSVPLTKSSTKLKSKLLQLYASLDSAGLHADLDQLTHDCLATVPCITSLISALLEWSCSPYRYGKTRVYQAARIISNMRVTNYDIDSDILTYLGALTAKSSVQVNNIYETMGELVRLDSFSVGRYMQWLMSSGALYNHEEMSIATGLLASLPTEYMPGCTLNLRRTLLSRLEMPEVLEEHAKTVQASIAELEAALLDSTIELVQPTISLEGPSLSVRVAVTEHVRRRVRLLSKDPSMDLNHFCLLRRVLESLSDVPTLVELLNAVAYTEDTALLATLTDTVLRHSGSLAALGQLQSLTDLIIERYRVLRSQQPLDRTLVLAVIALQRRQPDTSSLLAYLANDAVLCDQQGSLTVCSPASDSLIGMHASSLDCDADIDAVFASGNSMDDHLMQRVFMRIVQRACSLQREDSGPVNKLSAWFNQLRLVGATAFDQLASSFVRSIFRSSEDGSSSVVAIAALIASGCVTFEAVVTCARSCGTQQAASLAMRLLLTPNAFNLHLPVTEAYYFQTMQAQCRSEQVETVSALLCIACEDPSFPVAGDSVIDLVISYTAGEPCLVRRVFKQLCKRSVLLANAARLASALIMRNAVSSSQVEKVSPGVIMKLASPLSTHLCAGVLEYYGKAETSHGLDAIRLVQDALVAAIVNGNEVWPQLLDAVAKPVKRGVHDWALEQLVFASTLAEGAGPTPTQDKVDRYLDVADVTFDSVKDRDATATLVRLTEWLRDIRKLLADVDVLGTGDGDEVLAFSRMLRIVLHVCTLYTVASPTETEACRQARGALLLALCTLLSHSTIQTQQDLAEYVGDVASLLADSLPEVTLAGVAQSASKLVDARVQAILGTAIGRVDTWLALASQLQPPGTQQQRALAKHASQIPQASARSGAQGQAPGNASQNQRAWPHVGSNRAQVEMKMTPFPLRRWEIMPDATPTMGENDSSLSLVLFGARKG